MIGGEGGIYGDAVCYDLTRKPTTSYLKVLPVKAKTKRQVPNVFHVA